MSLRAIKYENFSLEILDQLLLPAQTKYIQVKGVEDGWKAINKMQVSINNGISNCFYIFNGNYNTIVSNLRCVEPQQSLSWAVSVWLWNYIGNNLKTRNNYVKKSKENSTI